MSRDLSAEMEAAARAIVARPVVFVELVYATETWRAWSGVGTRSWNGSQWLGVGSLGAISAMQETTDLRVPQVTLQLSGVDPEIVRKAVTDRSEYFNRPARIYVGFRQQNSEAVVVSPALWYAGTMDRLSHSDNGQAAVIEMIVVNEMADLERARVRRYQHQDQIKEYPSDKFFEYLSGSLDSNIPWGDFRGL